MNEERITYSHLLEIAGNGVYESIGISLAAGHAYLSPSSQFVCIVLAILVLIGCPIYTTIVLNQQHSSRLLPATSPTLRATSTRTTPVRSILVLFMLVATVTFAYVGGMMLTTAMQVLAETTELSITNGRSAVHAYNSALVNCLFIPPPALSSTWLFATNVDNFAVDGLVSKRKCDRKTGDGELRLDEQFLSPNEVYTYNSSQSCMMRTTKKQLGESYLPFKADMRDPDTHKPNVIMIVVESMRHLEFTSGLNMTLSTGEVGSLTPFMDRIKKSGVEWTNFFATNFQSDPAYVAQANGRFADVNGGITYKPKLAGYTDHMYSKAGYDLLRLAPNGFEESPLSEHLPWEGRLRHNDAYGFVTVDDDMVPLITEPLTERYPRVNDSQEATQVTSSQARPFYLEVRTVGGTHTFWETHEESERYLLENGMDSNYFSGLLDVYNENVKARYLDPADPTGQLVPSDTVDDMHMHMLKSVHLADRFLEKTIDELKAKAAMNNTLLIVFGDHGSGMTHGIQQNEYDDQFQTPFIITDLNGDVLSDEVRGTKINDVASNMDIGPTVLDLVGIDEYTTHGIGHSMLRKEDDKNKCDFTRERTIVSRIRNSMIVRNNTHSIIYQPVAEGVRERAWDRRIDPHQRDAPATDIIIPLWDGEGLKHVLGYRQLEQKWLQTEMQCPDIDRTPRSAQDL